MSDYPDFVNPTPIIVPPVAEVVWDRYWLRRLTINAPTPQEPATLYAEFRPCRNVVDEQGNMVGKEVKPEVDGDIQVFTVNDLFAVANGNQGLQNVLAIVLSALNTLAFPAPVPAPEPSPTPAPIPEPTPEPDPQVTP